MNDQEFEPNWVLLLMCIGAILAFVYMNAWMDVSFEVEKARAAKHEQGGLNDY